MGSQKQKRAKQRRVAQQMKVQRKQNQDIVDSQAYVPEPIFTDHTEGEDWGNYLKRSHTELPGRIQIEMEQVEQLLIRYNTFDILANLIRSEAMINPETFREPEHHGFPVLIELAGLIYLNHPYCLGDQLLDAVTFNEIRERLNHIVHMTMWYHTASGVGGNTDPQSIAAERLSHHTKANELLVGPPAYPHHQIEVLHSLFDGISSWMMDNLGFTVDDVIHVKESITPILIEKFYSTMSVVQEQSNNLLTARRDYMKSGLLVTDDNADLVTSLSLIRTKNAKEFALNYAVSTAFASLGNTLSFTAEEIAHAADLPEARVEAVLHFFTTPFESVSKTMSLMSPTHELKSRPILHHDGRYMVTSSEQLLWAVKPAVEEALNPGSPSAKNHKKAVWESYCNQRARYLEDESLRLFTSALKHSKSYRGLKYTVMEDGVEKNCELDGLVIFDNNLFLIECKAGAFSRPARRGASDRLRRDIEQLITKAHEQAARAIQHISERSEAEFVTLEGERLVIEKGKYKHIFPVAVTLDCMEVAQTLIYEVAELGLLKEGELPWAIYLNDLRVISELIEFPCQLVHYLQRRKLLNELKHAVAHDELDWFGNYLHEGLYFRDIVEKKEVQAVFLTSYTVDIDSYYYYEQGLRTTPAPKPVQNMPPILHQIVQELETVHHPGYSTVACTLFDMSSKSRREFLNGFDVIRRKTQQDRKIHNLSLVFDGHRFGITVFSAIGNKMSEADRRLRVYVQMKKYQMKADLWVGFLTVADTPGLIHGWVVDAEDWRYDADREEVCARFFGIDTGTED